MPSGHPRDFVEIPSSGRTIIGGIPCGEYENCGGNFHADGQWPTLPLYGAKMQTSPVAVPCVRLAHGGASLHTDRCHSLRSLHLPPAALPSLPLPVYRRPPGGDNPSVSFADSSLYTREPLAQALALHPCITECVEIQKSRHPFGCLLFCGVLRIATGAMRPRNDSGRRGFMKDVGLYGGVGNFHADGQWPSLQEERRMWIATTT